MANNGERSFITVIRPDGAERRLSCRVGESLLSALREAGLAPDAPCGGRGSCGRCRVRAAGALSPIDRREKTLLAGADPSLRLACQAEILGDCRVALPPEGSMLFAPGGEAGKPVRPLYRRLGAAVDLGTTTLAVRLYDAEGFLGERAGKNPQAVYGADVTTRLGAAIAGQGKELQAAAANGIRALLEELAQAAGRSLTEIDALVIAGNTAMLTLLAGSDPTPLTKPPFSAARASFTWADPAELGLTGLTAQCCLPPCPAAYVGADALLSLLSSGMTEGPETALLADVGTNGELALWHEGRVYAASAPAGPAVEGAGLSWGCLGGVGAVDRVWTEQGEIRCRVIGGGAAMGVCGSGAVDALAAYLNAGYMDSTGRICRPRGDWAEGLCLPLAGNVTLSQKDIRSLQLAKSAVYAGMETLLHRAGLAPEQVERFYLAGGFGSYVDPESAARMGLIPRPLETRTRVLGNAALTGAAMLLLDSDRIETAEKLAAAVEHVELAADPDFMDRYVAGMEFPEE